MQARPRWGPASPPRDRMFRSDYHAHVSTSLRKLDFPPSIIGGLAWVGMGALILFLAPAWGRPFPSVLGVTGGYFVVRAYRIAIGEGERDNVASGASDVPPEA